MYEDYGNYYDEQYKLAGVDYDLWACMRYNSTDTHPKQVKKVIAVIEGENDGPPWHWLLQLHDGREVYMTGDCDYTGWDCQSSATEVTLSPTVPLSLAVRKARTADYLVDQVIEELDRQRQEGKQSTWREEKDKEFGL